MARTRQACAVRTCLQRVLPCLGKSFVLIPVLVPNPPLESRQAKGLRDVLLAAGAVEVVYGRVSEAIIQAALTDEIKVGHLPEDARKLATKIEDITVFCHTCAEDIRCVVKRIEDGILDCQPLQVEELFIDYKSFRKDIVHLGMKSFECSSPRHPRHVKAHVVDGSDLTELIADGSEFTEVTETLPSVDWRSLDEQIQRHYMLDTELTGLSETTFQDLNCAVYRLFVNKDFLLDHSSKGDLKDSSPFLGVLLKLLGGLMTMLKCQFSQTEDGVETSILQKLLSFQENVDKLFSMLTPLDPDGSFRLFMSNTGIDWAAILEFIVQSSLELKNSLQNIVRGLMDEERAGSFIDRKLLKDSIQILKASSLYKTIVEDPYLRLAAEYYSGLSKRRIRILDVGEYVKEVEAYMNRELHLVRQFMDPKVETEIIKLVTKEMIGDHMTRLVLAADSHMSQLIAAGNYDIIKKMFRLVLNIPNGSASLCTALAGYIKRTLGILVADEDKEPIEYIRAILEERQKCERIIKTSLPSNMRVASEFSFLFREISGGTGSLRLPESLSLFMDHLLVQKAADLQAVGYNLLVQKATDLQAVDRALDKAIVLVADFDDKSVFQIYYQRHLADRLLSGTYNEGIECEVLLKLKLYCCPHYLDKLRTMINDIRSSELVVRSFHDSNTNTSHICVRMLRTHFWPKYPTTTCKLPKDIMQSWELFREHYLKLHNGRKLTWTPSLGNAVVTARFGGDYEYELILPMYHLCILMLFNMTKILSFDEIQYRTCIPKKYLKKCLVDLTSEGQNILKKESNEQIIRKAQFYVNDQFSSKLKKLIFASVVTLKDVHVVLDEDATSALDSVIIKVLKEKPTGLSFNGVVKRLVGFLRDKFCITPRAVQMRLGTLMQWELVRKQERDGNMYYRYYLY